MEKRKTYRVCVYSDEIRCWDCGIEFLDLESAKKFVEFVKTLNISNTKFEIVEYERLKKVEEDG